MRQPGLWASMQLHLPVLLICTPQLVPVSCLVCSSTLSTTAILRAPKGSYGS